MIVASRSVTRSRGDQPAGFRSRHTGVRGARHDQQPGLVVDGSTGGPQGGLADPEVVTAQEQVNRLRAARGRRHHHRDHWPCRTAAGPRGNVDRHGSLQVGGELLARDGRPVRPPLVHVFTIKPAWMRRQGRCSRAARPWVLLGCGRLHSRDVRPTSRDAAIGKSPVSLVTGIPLGSVKSSLHRDAVFPRRLSWQSSALQFFSALIRCDQ